MTQVKTSTRRTRGSAKQAETSQKHLVAIGSGIHAGKYWVRVPNGLIDEITGKEGTKVYGPYPIERAIAKRDEHLAKREEGQTIQPGREKLVTVENWWKHWIAQVKLHGSAGSYNRYSSAGRRHVLPRLGGVGLKRLTKTMIEQWQAELVAQGVGIEAVNYALKRLKTCLEAAIKDEAASGITVNPARNVEPLEGDPKAEYEGRFEDYLRLHAALEGDYRQALPQVGVDSGLRRSELLGLHWADVDLEAQTLTIRWHFTSSNDEDNHREVLAFRPGSKAKQDVKGGRLDFEKVHLSEDAVEALREHYTRLLRHKMGSKAWAANVGKATKVFYAANKRAAEGRTYVVPQDPVAPTALVFPSSDGTPYVPDSFGGWFTGLCKRLGINKTPHGMRHDCGSFQLALNVPITVVSKHLRHASVDITAKVYAHILQGDERRGADALAAKWAAMRAAQEIAV